MVGENRADVRQAVVELRRTLTNLTDATARLDSRDFVSLPEALGKIEAIRFRIVDGKP